MAVTNEQVASYLAANPGLSDAQIAQTMAQFNVTPAQMAAVTGIPESQVAARVAATLVSAAPEPAQTTASNPTWDYDSYYNSLKTGNTDYNQELGRLGGVGATNAQNIYREILAQQAAGSSDFWYAGNTASKEAAAADFALRLAENGIGSLSQLGQITIPGGVDGEGGSMPDEQVTINTTTGQPIPRPELLGRGNRDLDIDYNLTFTANGQVIPYTSNRESSWMSFRENALKPAASFALAYFGAPMIGAAVAPAATAATQAAIGGAIAGGGSAALTDGNVLQGALLGGVGGYLRGVNAVAPGLGPQTDASFLAADAAQLASQGLSESAIAQVLGASGYASGPAASLAASMAVNGLDVGTMTQQLDALSTNTGLMSQTGSSADFLAADALQLQGQVGNNFPAIEQNLIASGVDPLIAADISQQLAFNPGLTQTQLATNLSNNFGNNIYDVNTATTYPTSVLPGSGGLLSDVAGSTTTATTATSGLTNSQIASLLKAGLGLAGLGATTGAVGGGNTTTMQSPTQGTPTGDANYYNQLQQYYNAYLPQTPRDVVSPLQQWYSGTFGQTLPTYASIAANTAVNVPNNTGSITDPALLAAITALTNRTATTATTGTTARPVTPTAVTPVTAVTTTAPPSGLLNSALLNDSVYRDTAQAVAATGTPAQKAEWYNSMLSSGYDDASVKALVDSAVGEQKSADWAYLQQLAASQTAQPEVYQPPVYQPEVYQPPAVSVQPPINPPLPVSSNLSLFNDAVYRDTAQTVASTGTPAQKAEWYNSMIGSGYSDAAVKALVDSAVGPQSSSDWAYLQQLAASR